MNPRLLRLRARLRRAARAFFDDRGFVEIEAPTLVRAPGLEPHLDAFEVQAAEAHAGIRYLQTSPEYALKRLLGAGFDKLYSLCPCFRDEPPSRTHSPEFTMLEWYEAGLDLHGLMDQTEALIMSLAAALGQDLALPLETPFERLTVRAAFQRYAGVDPWAHPTAEGLRLAARAAGLNVHTESPGWDDVFFQIHLNEVEPQLGQGRPTFLWGWPASQAALSRLDPEDPTTALRFELFLGGLEVANAFDELIDPVEQRARLEADQAARREANRVVYPIDEALLTALATMRPTAGIAVGFDRLVMALCGASDIAQTRVLG